MTPDDAPPLEQLCAWMDGELSPDQARFLQRRLDNDPELRAQWERWQLASACLRGQSVRLMPPSLADGVAAAVAQAPRRRSRWPWLASAAAAVLVAVLLPRTPEVPPGPPALAPAATLATAPGQELRAAGVPDRTRVLAQSPVSAATSISDFPLAEFDGRRPWPRSPLLPESRSIEPYLVRHNALMAEDGLGGFMPYVDVVAHEADAEATPPADEPAR